MIPPPRSFKPGHLSQRRAAGPRAQVAGPDGPVCAHLRELREEIRRHHRLRHRWSRFSGARLRRRLFLWFGAAIFVTAGVNVGLAHLSSAGHWQARVPPAVFVVVPFIVLWAAAGKVARRIARPLDELVGVAQEIGAGQLGARARLPWGGIDEIADLSQAINDMAERIERQLADQRELLAGVSHEIRTPLAHVRLLVEIGREQGREAIDLDALDREVIEMDALVAELLASARLDFSAVTPMPIDGAELARQALDRAGVDAARLRIESHDTRFVGDPTLLGRALANLLRNGAVHGEGVDGVSVAVAGAADPDRATITFTVQDRGPGFPPGEEQRVFDRFYRPQRHDSVAPAGGPETAAGLGLGLALVRRIAEAHRGEAVARNRPGGGAEVSLILPIHRAERPRVV